MPTELRAFDPDRFQDVRRIGAGSNATVYVAWDRDLERPVALKSSVHDSLLDMLGGQRLAALGIADGLQQLVEELAEATRTRYTLLREARLLARIRHPHVVPVLDIGVLDGSLTLVLPYLSGGTLDEQAIDAPWTEVLELVLALGDGIAAIHAAGLLHRDIKPNNVLLDDRGTPYIADLGLACRLDDEDAMAEWPGTAAYMAPETLARRHRDQRDDLYAFCIVAFQMVYGHQPFASASDRARGRVSQIERPGLPTAVREVLARGLAPDPEQRWPDMPTLLAALRDAGRPRARRWLALVGMAAAMIAFALGLASANAVWASSCDDVEDELESIWNREIAAELGGVLGSRETVRTLDDWARHWLSLRRQECEHARQTDAPPLPSPCAEQLRRQLAITIEVLFQAGIGVDAAALIDSLPAPDRCLKQPDTPLPAGGAVELREADIELQALLTAEQFELAAERLEQFTQLARTYGGHGDLALASLRRGQLERRTGRLDDAVEMLEFAYERAVASARDEVAAEAMLELSAIAGQRGQLSQLDAHVLAARSLLERVAPERIVELLEIQGQALMAGSQDDRVRAVELLRDAVAQRERGHQQHATGLAQLALARALRANGEHDDALAQVDATLDEAVWDPVLRHAGLRLQFSLLLELGRIDQAERTIDELLLALPSETAKADEWLWIVNQVEAYGNPRMAKNSRDHGMAKVGQSR